MLKPTAEGETLAAVAIVPARTCCDATSKSETLAERVKLMDTWCTITVPGE